MANNRYCKEENVNTNRKQPILISTSAGCIFFVVLLQLLCGNLWAAEATPDCAIHKSGCTKPVGDRLVELDIYPKPVTAMQELTFTVSISGGALEKAPYIDLGMPGMHMGPNRVELTQSAAGVYEGRGVIVRCPSGKKIWRATLTLPSIGKAEYTFDVVY